MSAKIKINIDARLFPIAALGALLLTSTARAEDPGDAPPAESAPLAFGIFGDGPGDVYALQAQGTVVEQFHPAFRSPYRGADSLDPGARGDETTDVTAYAGFRPWSGAEIWADPEIDQGFGLSDTLGVDGFPSAEAYKIGHPYPYFKIQKFFLRQTFNLGGGRQSEDGDLNQFAGSTTADRIVLTVGKMSVTDVFDTNPYAHDARNDFLNWALVDTGTFDYAADAWGFTYGGAAEWYQGAWTVRAGLFDLSQRPNSSNLDYTFSQFQVDAEGERRFTLLGHPGALRVTGFLTRGRMGKYDAAVALADQTGGVPDVGLVRRYKSRAGLSFNLDQELTDTVGLFVRGGHSQGSYEGFDFTDISNTLAAGLSIKGALWGRKDDTFGFAGVDNEASKAALAYFAAGGLGILAGDGELPHPGPEKIIETYYCLPLITFTHLTVDYQFVDNPAFNRDRGPASIFGLRIHAQI